jgi:hypothetical protein
VIDALAESSDLNPWARRTLKFLERLLLHRLQYDVQVARDEQIAVLPPIRHKLTSELLAFSLGIDHALGIGRADHLASFFVQDEPGWLFKAPTGMTWVPTGETSPLRRISKRRELSTANGLTINCRIYKRHFFRLWFVNLAI